MVEIRLATEEKKVVACLSYQERPVQVATIISQCDLYNYPAEQLLKRMVGRKLLLERKNITNGKLLYSINPAYLERKQLQEMQQIRTKQQNEKLNR